MLTLSMTTGDLRNESIDESIINVFKSLDFKINSEDPVEISETESKTLDRQPQSTHSYLE